MTEGNPISISEENSRFMFVFLTVIMSNASVGISLYMILIYDILLTFDDELRYMWKWRKGLYPFLFFLIFSSIFVHGPTDLHSSRCATDIFIHYPLPSCEHYVRYEGSIHCVVVANASLIMLIRTVLLYGKNRWVAGVLCVLWCIEVASLAFFLTGSESKTCLKRYMPYVSECCTLVYKESLGDLDSISIAFTLVFDTFVLGLTVVRVHASGADGVLLLVFTIMIATTPTGIRSVAGQVAELLTAIVTSRLCIDIRKAGEYPSDESTRFDETRTASPMIFSENEELEIREPPRAFMGDTRQCYLRQESVYDFNA
ncbi:hypothetical protein SCHPADRAFT_891319 [Schizopora paradoxa]|uniref:DUF6533 domain-containing protein n=1 Tax=Schizopora paradoxa TaxID=27342 RepID=A0A0H2RQN3_9AGAM|nr:hypothetical protein SCHPADRAFT_891319 [Schizopora paradoxa]